MSTEHQIQGQHIQHGVVYSSKIIPEVINQVGSLEFDGDDVLITAYVRAGESFATRVASAV